MSIDAVARQPGTVGAAVGASVEDGGGGGGELRGDAVRGARRATRDGVNATRGRRRRRRAQIVSNGAVQAEERERRGELVGKSHLCRSRLPAWYAHRFAPRLLGHSTMGWGCAMRDARSCSALLRAYLLASLVGRRGDNKIPFARSRSYIIFAGEFSHASRRRPGMFRERYDGAGQL